MADRSIFETQAANSREGRLLRKARRRWNAKVIHAHRKLFLDEDGKLKPEAKVVLEDWARASKAGKIPIHLPDQVMRAYYGMQALYCHILRRLGAEADEYREMGKSMEEMSNE